MPPPDSTGSGMPAAPKHLDGAGEELEGPRGGVREHHEALEAEVRQLPGQPRQLERGVRGLHAVTAEAGVAFDQHGEVAAGALRRGS